MSIPLDRLYHYIQDVAEQVHNNPILIYRFSPHGSKNIEDLDLLSMPTLLDSDCVLLPQIFCNDQEPLDYDFYQKSNHTKAHVYHKNSYNQELELPNKYNLRTDPWNIYDKCLLLHSEKCSQDVYMYKNSHFIPVYYWAHAVIALDWFRYVKHIDIKPAATQTQFLIYNRAWAGTREYRIKFVDLLQKNNLIDDCKTSFNAIDPDSGIHYTDHVFKNSNLQTETLQDTYSATDAPGWSSADFCMEDYANTKIEIVLETLFDDTKIQLTEKILRPIACGHPFMLASTPGSLQYLREYGFKTFSDVIDESYDTEQDPVTRLNLIVAAMKQIVQWTPAEQETNWAKIKEITQYNKKHFFSDDFFGLVLDELKNNLKSGLTELEDTNTGKTFINLRIAYYNILRVNKKIFSNRMAEIRVPDCLRRSQAMLIRARTYYNQYLKSHGLN
jgi:hypothetical protein